MPNLIGFWGFALPFAVRSADFGLTTCTLSYLINVGPCLFFFKSLLYLHINNATPAFFVFIELSHSRQGIFNRCINLFFNANNSEKLNINHYLCLFQVLRFSSFFPNHHVYSVLHIYYVVKNNTDLPCLILNFFSEAKF